MPYANMTKPQLIEQLTKLQHYQRSFAEAAYSIFMVDLYGKIVEVNNMCCTMFGYTQQELTAMHLIDLVATEHIPDLLPLLEKIRKGGIRSVEWQLKCKNNLTIACELTGNTRRVNSSGMPYFGHS